MSSSWLTSATVAIIFAFASQVSAADLIGPATVVDGDTIRVGTTVVRLEGIDAPEASQQCRDAEGRLFACGQRAARFLNDLIEGEVVSCELTGRDRYGRALGICFVAGRDINSEMVRSGWALAFRRYSARYVGEEREVEASGAGLWSGTFYMPWDWRAGIVTESGNAMDRYRGEN